MRFDELLYVDLCWVEYLSGTVVEASPFSSRVIYQSVLTCWDTRSLCLVWQLLLEVFLCASCIVSVLLFELILVLDSQVAFTIGGKLFRNMLLVKVVSSFSLLTLTNMFLSFSSNIMWVLNACMWRMYLQAWDISCGNLELHVQLALQIQSGWCLSVCLCEHGWGWISLLIYSTLD